MSSVFYKIKSMTGGLLFWICLLVSLSVVFIVTKSVLSLESSSVINLVCIDNDNTELSKVFVNKLENGNGINIVKVDLDLAEEKLKNNEIDCILLIDKGFEEGIEKLEKNILELKAIKQSEIIITAKTIINDYIIEMQSKIDAKNRLKADNIWNEEVSEEFEKQYNKLDGSMEEPFLYVENSFETSAAKGLFDDIQMTYDGIFAIVLMLIMLSLSSWFADFETKEVSMRTRSVKNGKILSKLTDFLAVFIIAIFISAIAIICYRELSFAKIIAYLTYSICLSGLTIFIGRMGNGTGLSVIVPFIAVITTIFGGCFYDIASLGNVFRIISLLTPQAHMLNILSGNYLSALLLIFVGITLGFFEKNK